MKLSELELIRMNLNDVSLNFIQFHSMLRKNSSKFTQTDSNLLDIGSIRIQQMTGHLNDWTHSDLHESYVIVRVRHAMLYYSMHAPYRGWCMLVT